MQNQKRDIKILVSADIRGRFEQVMSKVSQLHAKNHFDIMLLLGEVCHSRSALYVNSIKNGEQSLPLPIYFIDNSQLAPVLYRIHPKGTQIVKDFNYLGNYGVLQILGLNIAYFGNNSQWSGSQPPNVEVESFLQACGQKQIDILMTNEWPKEIKAISQKSVPKTADYVSKVAAKLNPRYHLAAGSDSFYRMSPYRNSKGNQTHFICVAPCEEQLKDKYLFALTIKPNHLDLAPEDANFLNNPYAAHQEQNNQQTPSLQQKLGTLAPKRSQVRGQTIIHFQGFPEWARKQDISEFLQRWGELKHLECYKDKRGGHSGTVRFLDKTSTQRCLADTGKFMFHSTRIKFQARSLNERQRVEDCWFCKVNSDRSLVVWQGRYLYVSLQKGPLSRFHIQIIPYNHTESSGKLDAQQRQQLSYIQNGLIKHFTRSGYQVIRYQRCLPLSEAINHCVIHLLPIKSQRLLTAAFEKLNKEDGLNFRDWNGGRRNSQYFLELQIGGKFYLKEVQRREKVQADFMRQLLCQLFDTPKLVNWKACERNTEQLAAQKTAFAEELSLAGIST